MLDAKIFSGNDFKNRLIFEMDGTAYSLNYAEIDALINPKIHKGRIAGCADISSFYPVDYVIGCWENPTNHFVSLLLDVRSLLGLEKREYSPSAIICALHEEDLRKYALVLDGLSERFADEEKTGSRIVVEISLREILSGQVLDQADKPCRVLKKGCVPREGQHPKGKTPSIKKVKSERGTPHSGTSGTAKKT